MVWKERVARSDASFGAFRRLNIDIEYSGGELLLTSPLRKEEFLNRLLCSLPNRLFDDP